jgi:hypothetical protein
MIEKDEVQVTKSFEDKMKDRVKESIGDLISDEDLRPLIIAGVKEIFTKKPRSIENYRTVYGDSLIEAIVKDHSDLKEVVTTEVNNWLNENSYIIKEILNEHIKDNVVDTFKQVVNEMTANTFMSFKYQLQNDLNQILPTDNQGQY